LVAAFPATADPRYITGNKDGVSFSYTEDVQPNGDRVLRGEYTDTGERFILNVAPDGHVEGSVGSEPVSFDVAREQQKRAADGAKADDHSYSERR